MVKSNIALEKKRSGPSPSGALTAELTEVESRILTDCESTIRNGLHHLVQVAQSLQVIRDQRLYRIAHKTFEEYCAEKWAIGRSYAYRLIDCAVVLDDLSTVPDKQLPTTESQIRELKRVSSDIRPQVWERVIAASADQPVTARRIRDVVLEFKGKEVLANNGRKNYRNLRATLRETIETIKELRGSLGANGDVSTICRGLDQIEASILQLLATAD